VLEVPRKRQSPLAAGDIIPVVRKALTKKPSAPGSKNSNWPEVEQQKINTRQSFNMGGCEIEITNIEKELWKDVRKFELIQYYHTISKYLFPHIQDRPQSLHVKLHGPNAPGFYIKDMEGRQPECADIFSTRRKHKKAGKRDVIDYLVANNEPTLLWMINLGCIDVNPWTSRASDPLHPDYIIIDLDPSDNDFSKAVEAAQATQQVLQSRKLTAFLKTSGKTGIHIYLPCSGFSFPQARDIAEALCGEVHALLPKTTTTAVSISKRGNKLYLDPNQNDEADTVAAPYSVRPYQLPLVSTPLEWKELNSRLDPTLFNIHTIAARIKKKGELFKDVLAANHRNRNTKILAKLF
jgi:bifunctional non-homologous end joining protein LigD